MLASVCDADEDAGNAHSLGDGGTFARKNDLRFAQIVVGNLHVSPLHLAAHAGAEGLEDGFLGGESSGEVLNSLLVLLAIGLLVRSEDAVQKTVAVMREHFVQARALDYVNAMTEDSRSQFKTPISAANGPFARSRDESEF